MKRHVNAPNEEPEESNFKIPSEGEKLFQVVDCNSLVTPSGQDENIQIVKLEVVTGNDEGLTILQRINLDDSSKSFYYTRLFLKSISEPYKGEFDISPDNWIGKQMYATVKHTQSKGKTYANIAEYNFDKPVEQYKPPVNDKKDEIVW